MKMHRLQKKECGKADSYINLAAAIINLVVALILLSEKLLM